MGKNAASATTTQKIGLRYFDMKIVKPGYAYPVDHDEDGIVIRTNFSPDDINRRAPYFRTREHVWAWAQRVYKSSER